MPAGRAGFGSCGDGDHGGRPLRIIYIGGFGRSGSTLLARLLGEAGNAVPVGELFDVWRQCFIRNRRCGCGRPFDQCEFWLSVAHRGFGRAIRELPVTDIQMLKVHVTASKHIPAIALPFLRSRSYRRELSQYTKILQDLYQGINLSSDADFIVDSSKVPQFAWLLCELENVEVHVIHLVRDSRAAVYSWSRDKLLSEQPGIRLASERLRRHSLTKSTVEWNALNLMLEMKNKCFSSYTFMRYEDLVADPWRELKRVAESVAAFNIENPEGFENTWRLGPSHIASGNPDKFTIGPVAIEYDRRWQTMFPRLHRWLVTTLTLPLLVRYQYIPVRIRSRRSEPPSRPTPSSPSAHTAPDHSTAPD
jgi:Sulfotransferase family